MRIQQGDLFLVDFGAPRGSAPAYRRPAVIVQNDVFNASRIATVVVCPLTTNLARARAPGNVLLVAGEGGLPEQSVVNVSQVFTMDKRDLVQPLGRLGRERVREVVAGLRLVLEPRATDDQAREG